MPKTRKKRRALPAISLKLIMVCCLCLFAARVYLYFVGVSTIILDSVLVSIDLPTALPKRQHPEQIAVQSVGLQCSSRCRCLSISSV